MTAPPDQPEPRHKPWAGVIVAVVLLGFLVAFCLGVGFLFFGVAVHPDVVISTARCDVRA
jgi:hypothetical protein